MDRFKGLSRQRVFPVLALEILTILKTSHVIEEMNQESWSKIQVVRILIKILYQKNSTLTLCHLSRAILSMNLRWVRGPTLTRAKVEFPSKRIKNIYFFFQEKFLSILGTGCPKIGHRVPKNWAPEIWAPDRPPPVFFRFSGFL